jgi:hypothetical protein
MTPSVVKESIATTPGALRWPALTFVAKAISPYLLPQYFMWPLLDVVRSERPPWEPHGPKATEHGGQARQ